MILGLLGINIESKKVHIPHCNYIFTYVAYVPIEMLIAITFN